ncbi:MAG: hypothetical protein JKY65_27050, partial [Planctomycetes bacterium]|nr:hypothetical protein [Planctomycetota bacterium]
AREAELEAGQAHRDSAAASRQAAEFVEHLGAKVARGLDELAEPFDQVRSEQEASEQEASEQEATKQGEDWRAGDWRAGDWRAGDWRAGDWRAGDWRAGDWRAGDWRAGDWRAGFAQDPTAFIADLSKRSAAAADARSRQESARAELERFEPRAAATQAEATAAERALAAAEELCEVADRLREAAQVEVTGLGLGPETLPSQLLASLEDESARSQEDRVTAERERARAESTRAAAEALAAQVVAAQELARVAHQARREELGLERDQALLSLAKRLGDEERAQRGGAPDPEGNTSEERSLDLIALLRAVEAWTPAAATAARAAGEVLREALRSAEHDLRLRREALRGHEASGTPSFSAPEARAAVDAAGPRRATADEARSRIRGVLLADEAAKQEAEELSQRLETQRLGADRWQALGALIGSHDGKRLRVFAQSLTLELLLDQANLALADLAPRYRLARVTGQDLDLQVIDTTLGDEVRATSSLSGGESFLVSLALALGVGALSSQETSVESLFVDEGFGSLDTDAQELALSALDALQAGGRQVVLISHLPGLAERIGFGVRVVPQGRGRSRLEVGSLLATV